MNFVETDNLGLQGIEITKNRFSEPIYDLDNLVPYHFRPSLEQLLPFETQQDWLLQPCVEMGKDHSPDHPARVLIGVNLIMGFYESYGLPINPDSRLALNWFASIHDSQRLDDGDDLKHGERAANWALQNLHDKVPPSVLEEIIYLCRCHVPHDCEQDPLTFIAKIAKDGDMLDRGRGCNDLDINYARLDISRGLVHYMRLLQEVSLQMEEGTAFERVMGAALELNIIHL